MIQEYVRTQLTTLLYFTLGTWNVAAGVWYESAINGLVY